MLARLKPYPAKAAPITVPEFLNALAGLRLYDPFQATTPNHAEKQKRLGLAISGGVDSMAMASLCSQLAERQLQNVETRAGPGFRFHAFIVDHGVRLGSDKEAAAVSTELQKLNIPTEILRIQWPLGSKPLETPDFESSARTLRYQTLGNACRQWKIDALLTAHHQDDQAETVLMRLMNGHRGYGLGGIKPIADIPECFGIHGVSRSGLLDIRDESSRPEPRSGELQLEEGGIKIYRPLLEFSKDRLKVTCSGQGVGWFEDVTNADPTLTLRNTIRHVFSTNILPVALQKPRLLEISRKIQRRIDSLNDAASKTFREKAEIIRFEPRAGTIFACFPSRSQDNLDDCGLIEQRQRNVTLIWIRNLVECVSPEEHTHISSLSTAQHIVFPESGDQTSQNISTDTFTVAGVRFQRMDWRGKSIIDKSQKSKKCYWLISRQRPYRKRSSRSNILFPADYGIASSPKWILFDGRYWVRLVNKSSRTLLLRFLCKTDLQAFRNDLDAPTKRKLKDFLKDLASGDIKWTLPAIAEIDNTGKERILALPTIGIGVPDYTKLILLDLRFKKIPACVRHMAAKL